MKSQNVRLFDVLLLGPFLMWASRPGRKTSAERTALLLAGAGTILYNYNNYLRVQKKDQCARRTKLLE